MPPADTSALSAPAKENTMKKVNDGFDSLHAAQDYLNLPVSPGPIVADEGEKENETAIPHPRPPAERPVQVQLIHQRDYDAMKAAEAAAAEAQKEKRRCAAAKAVRTRKRRLRQARALERKDTRDHHERHCTICNSPDREAIEEAFLHWDSPYDLGREYEVGYRSVFRHAHARGLFAVRERNMRSALGNIIELSSNVKPTADAVIRAIRAYSCLNRDGQWIEPAAHVIVSSGSAALPAGPSLPAEATQRLLQPPVSSVEPPELPVTAAE
jgi:hypothetical protein